MNTDPTPQDQDEQKDNGLPPQEGENPKAEDTPAGPTNEGTKTEAGTEAAGSGTESEVEDPQKSGTGLPPGSTAPAEQADQESRVRNAIGQWAEAIREKDVDKVLSHFALSSVRFYLAPPLQAEVPLHDNLESWFATFEGKLGYEVRSLMVHAADDMAFAHSFNHVTGRRTDGGYVDLWFRCTLGLRRLHDEWQIVHAHESVPYLMDGSERAALHLLPPVSIL